MTFVSLGLMPGNALFISALDPENLAQNEARKEEKAWPAPTEPSLTEEQGPLSRGALLFWFPGRRQTLTQGQCETTQLQFSQPLLEKDVALPNLYEPEDHQATGGGRVCGNHSLCVSLTTVPSTLLRTGNTRRREAYMNKVSARLPSDPKSGHRPHTRYRQVNPGFQSSGSWLRSVLVSGRTGIQESRKYTPLSSNGHLKEEKTRVAEASSVRKKKRLPKTRVQPQEAKRTDPYKLSSGLDMYPGTQVPTYIQ